MLPCCLPGDSQGVRPGAAPSTCCRLHLPCSPCAVMDDNRMLTLVRTVASMPAAVPATHHCPLVCCTQSQEASSGHPLPGDHARCPLPQASNERIPLTASMRLLLEINHMNHCSPATVSRGGVIFVNGAPFCLAAAAALCTTFLSTSCVQPLLVSLLDCCNTPQPCTRNPMLISSAAFTVDDIGWKPAVESWISRLECADYRPLLTALFSKYVEPCLEHCRRNFKTVTPLPAINQVQTLMKVGSVGTLGSCSGRGCEGCMACRVWLAGGPAEPSMSAPCIESDSCPRRQILEGILPKETPRGAPPPDPKLLELHFVFASIWAFGGALLVDKVRIAR